MPDSIVSNAITGITIMNFRRFNAAMTLPESGPASVIDGMRNIETKNIDPTQITPPRTWIIRDNARPKSITRLR
jgi:hypothetical protein